MKPEHYRHPIIQYVGRPEFRESLAIGLREQHALLDNYPNVDREVAYPRALANLLTHEAMKDVLTDEMAFEHMAVRTAARGFGASSNVVTDFKPEDLEIDVLKTHLALALENVQLKRKLGLLERDELTGLLTRRSARNQIQALIDRDPNFPCAVMMIDGDRFKLVNDRWGHDVGDKVLRVLGSTVQEHVRPNDIGERYGGEEIRMTLLNVRNEADVWKIAERLLMAQRSTPICFTDKGGNPVDYRQKVSIGISPIGVMADHEQLSRWADNALYQAKDDGRDRAVVCDPHKLYTPNPSARIRKVFARVLSSLL